MSKFNDYPLLKERCEYYLQNKIKTHNVIIVSGADSLGEQFAKEHGLSCELHPADWNKHGRAAGPIRNAQMAEISDALIAFWDGKSRGTKSISVFVNSFISTVYGLKGRKMMARIL